MSIYSRSQALFGVKSCWKSPLEWISRSGIISSPNQWPKRNDFSFLQDFSKLIQRGDRSSWSTGSTSWGGSTRSPGGLPGSAWICMVAETVKFPGIKLLGHQRAESAGSWAPCRHADPSWARQGFWEGVNPPHLVTPQLQGHGSQPTLVVQKNDKMPKSSSTVPLQNTLWQLFCNVTFDVKCLVIYLSSLLGFNYTLMCTTSNINLPWSEPGISRPCRQKGLKTIRQGDQGTTKVGKHISRVISSV